jgi:hypothetical protein
MEALMRNKSLDAVVLALSAMLCALLAYLTCHRDVLQQARPPERRPGTGMRTSNANAELRAGAKTQNGTASRLSRLVDCGVRRLGERHVRGLQTLGALLDVELDRGALSQAAEAIALNRGKMDEDVLSALSGDEAEALGVVEPLHGTVRSHG